MKHCLVAYIFLALIKFSQSDENDKHFRLPNNVVPEYYKLKINTILEEDNFVFIGSVGINILCVEPTNKITLHSRNLTIRSVKLFELEDKQPIETKYDFEQEYDFLHISLEEDLEVNTLYRLKINFNGDILRGMSGYYRSSYRDETGKQKWIATTFFEPTQARAAFPCFDEPALRAVFSIELIHKEDFIAISNMPVKRSRTINQNGVWIWDSFEETPIISTYLVAYMVTDFGYSTTLKSNKYGNTTLNIWAPKKSIEQVEYAKEISKQILGFFEEYFDIAYPLPKSDLVAVPDFGSGAMENWGLIIFREAKLLYVSGKTSEADKHAITNIIAHELAHYWFGDLVTIKWWTYLWLKEGFATYLARVAVENLIPKWKKSYGTKTFLDNKNNVFNIDGLKHTRPVSVPISDPRRISEIFDHITYAKGACLIRMMELFLGTDIMRKGIMNYLKKNQYAATDKDDLWYSLSIIAHRRNALSESVNVSTIMDSWTQQSGFPFISVIRDYTKHTVSVTQHRFLENANEHDESCYWIPLSFTTERESDFDNTKAKMWLPCPKDSIEFENKKSEEWIIFNIQASGLYRVNYDETNWKMLIKQLYTYHKKIKMLNRMILLDDAIELAMTDRIDFKIAFDLLSYIRKDYSSLIWRRAMDKLNIIRNFLYSTPKKEHIDAFILDLLTQRYNSFGGIKSQNKISKLEMLIIENMCSLGHKECAQQAVQIFQKWMKSLDEKELSETIQPVVFCQGLKHGDEESWEFMWQQYLQSKVATEKNMILTALGCTQQEPLLNRYLGMMITNDSEIRHQDALRVFSSVIQNEKGFKLARKFFYDHVNDIYLIMSPPGNHMRHFLPLIARSLKTMADFDEFKLFAENNKQYFQMAHLTLTQMLEKVEIWRNWHKVIYPKLAEVLDEIIKNKGLRINSEQVITKEEQVTTVHMIEEEEEQETNTPMFGEENKEEEITGRKRRSNNHSTEIQQEDI